MENQDKQLFEGLTVHFGWTEGEQLKFPSGEIIKENQTFHGEKAYEVLVAMALKDKKLYEQSCMGAFLGYDKCKFTISLAPKDGKKGIEIENFEIENRVNLSELQLNCGGGPLDSLAWRLAGQKVELYSKEPLTFTNSYDYANFCEENENNEEIFINGKPSVRLAKQQFMNKHKEILDAFNPYILEEDKYLTAHPELKYEFQENQPKLYNFVIKAEDFEKYAPKCEIIDFKVAKNLDGKVFKPNNYYCDNLDKRNFENGEFYSNNDYYIVTSAFNISEWDRNDGKFLPYFTKEQYESIQNINKLEVTIEEEKQPFKFFRPTKFETIDDELLETDISPNYSSHTYQGKEALDELLNNIVQQKGDINYTLNNGFNFENGKKRYIVKYDNNIILDEISHRGIDDKLLKKCCNDESVNNCIPVKDNKLKKEIEQTLKILNMYFKDDESFYISKYDVEMTNDLKPTLEEMNKNRIKYLKNKAHDFRRFEKKEINNALMVLADKLAEKIPKQNKGKPVSKIERFAIAYTITAAEAGFDKESIKELVNEADYAHGSYMNKPFEKKVNSTLRTKKVNEIMESHKKQEESR